MADDLKPLLHFAADFAVACRKIKEGAETPGSAITLNHEECRAMIVALRIGFKKEDSDA